jgi:aerotaxis receptor
MGIVKNRCSNGDFYWVDAYVTPIFVQGQLTGYESVRVKPDRRQVERASALYAGMRGENATGTFKRRLMSAARFLFAPGAIAIACVAAFQWAGPGISALVAVAGLFALQGLALSSRAIRSSASSRWRKGVSTAN